MTALVDLGDERLRRDVERLHRQSLRVLLEFLVEIRRERMLRADIEERVGRYAELDQAPSSAGGAQFPQRAIDDPHPHPRASLKLAKVRHIKTARGLAPCCRRS